MDLSALEKDQAKGGRRPRTQKVKDKTAAPIQITAEQLLAEASARQEAEIRPPRQRIMDGAELEEFRFRERKKFEDGLRRQRFNPSNWTKYATFEESQQEWDRVRSIFERALEVDYRHPVMWIKYAEFEMKHKNVNLARNVLDRGVVLLPRSDQLWYKYAYMEEQLGNYVGARQIYERWMEWRPDFLAWTAFIKFELRYKEYDRIRQLYQRFAQAHPIAKTWIKWAKFEEHTGDLPRARLVYETAMQFLGEENADEKLFIEFAKFEERAKEFERARGIYKYALDHVPKHLAQDLYKMFISFEKQFGDRDAIEDVIVGKRRFQYEEELKLNTRNYDVWFDYARLEEAHGDVERVREVYERAISNVPPAQDKRFWRRYIYLWINYALFEEMDAQDSERSREVYKALIKQIPHKSFSFAKIWLQYAHFEVRQKNLQAARQVFGHAIGLCPKEKIFRAYIDFELKLGEVDRCRRLYEKLLSTIPANCAAWIKFADLEKALAEHDRARAIYELAISQPVLDMPEALWKAYIDFEIDLDQNDNVRQLYRRLLERTKHVKVWISAAQFEALTGAVDAARKIFDDAYTFLRNAPTKEEFESELAKQQNEGDVGVPDNEKMEGVQAAADMSKVEHVTKLMPKRVKKKRLLKLDDGTDGGWEEYYDYIFPDEQASSGALKILEMAQKWKKLKAAQQGAVQAVPAAAEAEANESMDQK